MSMSYILLNNAADIEAIVPDIRSGARYNIFEEK
jgi:hypothetical protein